MWKKLETLHQRLKEAASLWAAIAGIVGIFTLGASATYMVFDNFAQSDEPAKAAGHVDRRVTDLSSRIDEVVSWTREQISGIRSDKDEMRKEVSSQYQAINSRLDQQNMLIVEVLKAVKQNTDHSAAEPEADDTWSLIGTARAARPRAVKNN